MRDSSDILLHGVPVLASVSLTGESAVVGEDLNLVELIVAVQVELERLFR